MGICFQVQKMSLRVCWKGGISDHTSSWSLTKLEGSSWAHLRQGHTRVARAHTATWSLQFQQPLDDQSRIQNTNGQDAIHIHTGQQGSVNNVSWTVVHVTSIYRCPGLWWSPPAPSSSPACNDLPRSEPQGTYHMARARIRNSESCLSGTFLNWKQRGVYLALRKKKIKLLFSSLLGLKVVTTQRARAEERGHTLLSRATFSPNDSLFFWFGRGQFTSWVGGGLVLEDVSICWTMQSLQVYDFFQFSLRMLRIWLQAAL